MNQAALTYIRRFLQDADSFSSNPEIVLNALNESLYNISILDLSTSTCERVEMCLFFSKLWEVMSHKDGPHSNGILVLTTASKDAALLQTLIHDYKFFPILAEHLLSNKFLLGDKLKLLSLLEDFSQGIKINWHEEYLANLLRTVCLWIQNESGNADGTSNDVFIRSLSILVNLCHKNKFVTMELLNTVDVKTLVKSLMNRKDKTCGNVQVCRLLVSLHEIEDVPTAIGIFNYLHAALNSFIQSIRNQNASELMHIYLLVSDLCTDPLSRPQVLNFEHFEKYLLEALKVSPSNYSIADDNSKKCIKTIISILLCLVKLELFSLRSSHKAIANLCINVSSVPELLGPALNLLASIIAQYEEEGMLPDNLMPKISVGFNLLLDPIDLDIKKAGLDWLRFIGSLCDCHATREAVFINVNIERFEEIFKQNLFYYSEKADNKHLDQEVVLTGCHICLSLLDKSSLWNACLHRLLSLPATRKALTHCFSNIHTPQRKQFVRIMRDSNFPLDKVNDLFGSTDAINESIASLNSSIVSMQQSSDQFKCALPMWQHISIEELLKKINEAVDNDRISDVPASKFIELYNYKIKALEQRMRSLTVSLQTANASVIGLNHSMQILEETNQNQGDLLYRSQVCKERLEENIAQLTKQMADAEKTIVKFQSKLAAERLCNEQQVSNVNNEHTQRIKDLEAELSKNTEFTESLQSKLKKLDEVNNNLTDKLKEQTKKNNELVNVLIKFEERVKQKDKKLEEVNQNHAILKCELEQAQMNIKNLEKSLIERDKRLAQTTAQLEEMHRVQDIISNLMGAKGSSNTSQNSAS